MKNYIKERTCETYFNCDLGGWLQCQKRTNMVALAFVKKNPLRVVQTDGEACSSEETALDVSLDSFPWGGTIHKTWNLISSLAV